MLRPPVGGEAVIRAQLAQLLKAAQERHITVQVLPFGHGEHAEMSGSLTVLTLPDGAEVAQIED